MKAILNWFKQNKTATAMLVAVVVIMGSAAVMSGCSGLGDFIKHPVPKDMQEFNDGEGKVSINDAPFVLEDYLSSVRRNVDRFVADNEKAHLVHDFFSSILTIGIEELGNSPIPGATMLSGLLLGVGGLMTRKPGTAKEIASEKMASFNKGQEVALSQIRELVSPDKMRELLEQIKKES